MTPIQTNMANAIRALAMDAVEQAKSGHPGMPMGMAEIAVALWAGQDGKAHHQHNPANPAWLNRDRFMLSNGHGSMLHYALLHLSGYDLPMAELKKFRQLHSKTPGHPEVHVTPGIETSTGPLGQGLANAVGMALTEKLLAAEFNQPSFDVVNHHTYVFLGDGCLMEGVSHEVAALAGVWRLNKLIALYDDNGISIDGHVEPWFADDTPKRFEAYGWNVIRAVDGHNVDAVSAAIAQAKLAKGNDNDRPTLICCKTIIGKGAPNKQGGEHVHGAPLGAAEIAATRATLNWPYAPFEMPAEMYAAWDAKKSGAALEAAWNQLFKAYSERYPQLAGELLRRSKGELPAQFETAVANYLADCNSKKENIATRKASQNTLTAYALALPEFMGGSADLTGSNLTNFASCKALRVDQKGLQWGNHINYGVREFGMAAIMNGMALHGGYIPFGGTFLTFADYSRNALRMAALMKLRVVHVFTHDSIGVGEDGPTHQPVEHVSSLRLIPQLDVWRPCDTLETAAAWACAFRRADGPSALALTRQNLNYVARTAQQQADIAKGGYVISAMEKPHALIIATGSEVGLALEAHKLLAADNISTSVISMPCMDVFARQSADYQNTVLPAHLPCRVAIEAGSPDMWYRYTGLNGVVIGMTTFGESAPAGELFKHFGITAQAVVAAVKGLK